MYRPNKQQTRTKCWTDFDCTCRSKKNTDGLRSGATSEQQSSTAELACSEEKRAYFVDSRHACFVYEANKQLSTVELTKLCCEKIGLVKYAS
jgi:hypothetical protein